jgi:4-hydroxy-tetrahydrodipicolinate synthase
MTAQERAHIISITTKIAKGKVPVIVGCGTASLQQSIEQMQQAKDLGADATLVVTPYYVKPSQQGIIAYFKALHDAVEIPIVLYNNPGRVVVDMTIETIVALCDLPRVVGIKDSKMDASRFSTLRQKLGNRLALLSGEDSATAAHMLYGGDGAISVVANCAPDLAALQMNAWFNGNLAQFESVTHALISLTNALNVDVNPCSIKYAVSKLGRCTNELRLPLLPTSAANQQIIDEALAEIHQHSLAANPKVRAI